MHTTRLEYTADVVEGVTQARMGPHSDAHQHCHSRADVRGRPGVDVAVGRDYRDVAPTRGTYRGHALEQLYVEVQTRIEAE